MRLAILTKPVFWLLGQAVVLLVLCLTLDFFEFFPLDIDGYWETADDWKYHTWQGILSDVRTLAYPLFIKAVQWLSPYLRLLPFFQVLIRVLAVLIFYGGLRALRVREGLALVIASPLFWANAVLSYDLNGAVPRVSQIMTDAVGESLLIASIGLLFFVLANPDRVVAWLGFTISLFLTYQTRPVYQALVLLLPMLGWVLYALANEGTDWKRGRLQTAFGLLAACVLPLLAWCTFRLVTVGHFGLVSFTGNALCGVAGQVLTEDVLNDLPEPQRVYGEAVLQRHKDLSLGKKQRVFGPWKPAFDRNGKLRPGIVNDNHAYLYVQIDLFQETALQLYGEKLQDNVERDRQQLRMAIALIKARPGMFFQWVVESVRTAPEKMFIWNFLLKVTLGLVGLLAVVWHLLYLFRYIKDGPEALARRPVPSESYLRELNIMLLIALSIAVCQVVLVAALVAFLHRYYDSAGVFLPSVVMIVAAWLWGHVRALLPPQFSAGTQQPLSNYPRTVAAGL